MKSKKTYTEDKDNETYTVPSEVSMAVMTDRVVFLDMLANRLRTAGRDCRALTKEEALELVRMIRDLIEDRQRHARQIQEVTRRLENIVQASVGLSRTIEEARALLASKPKADKEEDAE
ncbi:MAG: hypothetical protein ABSG53_26715 [Thermoguttaceae bacterium]|jgi:hypothetical protein